MNWIRAVAAAGLSLVFPGTGHALLRDWVQAFLFGTLFIASIFLLLPVEQLWDVASETSATSVSGFREISAETSAIIDEETGTIERFTMSFLVLFAALHAGIQGLGITDQPGEHDDVPACPHCRKPLDDDLTFCHWCTTRLEEEEDQQPAV
ncbi:zinc ribbon domain-containing protein [Halovivax gelatinilyticus]|uniref:zinc ribbon domain-containing protein n=1 Tax=Halovivax gelatinilyticus TaxID=2961597 RepID=UPI0020CA7131|nr:zinc ribbon domain-containing protein [Halovivax gelatinilyticus]